jgi:hypothetical protein
MSPQEYDCTQALEHLGVALNLLKRSGVSKRCLDKVRLAISSAKGAKRHASHREDRRVA